MDHAGASLPSQGSLRGRGTDRRRIGVVGAGRVGAVLAAAWRRAGHDVVAVSGDSDASRGRAAALLPGVPVLKPSAVARACDVLVLAVPDDMIDNVARQLAGAGALRHQGAGEPHRTPLTVVHLSGRHGLAVLDPARDEGAATLALHPAMTFTGTERDLVRLDGCAVGTTCDTAAARDLAVQLVDDLGGVVVDVAEEHRSLYHAALAHGANHLVTLVAQAREVLAAAGATDPSATLRPLLQAALDNALESGDAALTGPIVRGDVETVRAHLRELLEHQPQAVASYVALARATAYRATLDARLVPLRAAAIERVLTLAETGRPELLTARATSAADAGSGTAGPEGSS